MDYKIEDFTFKRIETSYGVIEVRYQNQIWAWITTSPTANCQIFSLAQANNIFGYVQGDLLKQLLKLIGHQTNSKAMMLIDVNVGYSKKVEEVFPTEFIKLKSDYLSTNNSNMCMYLLNMSYIYNYKPFEIINEKPKVNENTESSIF